MRKNAEKVLNAFILGLSCDQKTISTDGIHVWSYAMMIARVVPEFKGKVELIKESLAPSRTTKQHIRACLNFISNNYACIYIVEVENFK